MEIKRFQSALEIKATEDETGTFTGYGSIFGNVDSYGDIVERGAFVKHLANNPANSVKLLWQHDTEQPIGVYDEIREDDHGLFVKGRLLVNEIAKAREAYALLKNGAISGLSIGYSINENGSYVKNNNLHLTDLKLWEISVVTFPANPIANVSGVKAADSISSIRDFEKFLRDAGFSQSKAKAISAHGYKALESDAQRDVDAEMTDLVKQLNQLNETIRGVNNEYRNQTSSR